MILKSILSNEFVYLSCVTANLRHKLFMPLNHNSRTLKQKEKKSWNHALMLSKLTTTNKFSLTMTWMQMNRQAHWNIFLSFSVNLEAIASLEARRWEIEAKYHDIYQPAETRSAMLFLNKNLRFYKAVRLKN